jgi:hypothetical protein
LAFILYLPGGLAELLHRLGDLVTMGVRAALDRVAPRRSSPPPATLDGHEVERTPALVAEGAEQ